MAPICEESIPKAVDTEPDGLLLHETLMYSLVPPHFGMRQYWRDFESLENWARSSSFRHSAWWKEFQSDPAGTGFWHELHTRDGGVEGAYADIDETPIGMMNFASVKEMRGDLFSARERLGRADEAPTAQPVTEDDLYTE
jgi:hypothetical protein